MPLTFQCTKFAVSNGRRYKIKDTPFLRMTFKGQEVYIQEGQVYAGGSERLNNLPDWFQTELEKQDKAALDAVGWTEHRKVGRPATKETLEKKLEAKADKKEPTKKESKVKESTKDA